jgi:hypothetical protein
MSVGVSLGGQARHRGFALGAVKPMKAPPAKARGTATLPDRRYGQSPVHRLDSHLRLAPAGAMPTNRHAHLSVALARLAVDLDDLVDEITAEPLDDGADDLYYPAIAELTRTLDRLDDATYELEKLDRRCQRLLATLQA